MGFMELTVIENPHFNAFEKAGFTRHQFQKLDALYLRAVQTKVLTVRMVDCDFEEGIAEFAYAKAEHHPPLFRFIIRQVGPRQVMYELHCHGKGRPYKSGLFDRVYERLSAEIEALLQ